MVEYNASDKIPSQPPEWASVMTNNLRLPRAEVLSGDELTLNAGKRAVWGPKQKNVSWMRDLTAKFSKLGNLTMNFRAGTCSAAKACMSLDQQRKSVKCNVDLRC